MGFFDSVFDVVSDVVKPVADVFTGGLSSIGDLVGTGFKTVGSVVGSNLGGITQAAGGVYSNQQSAEEAQKNRDWQERLANTAHQREIKDLKKARLNPILSTGAGANTPGGAVASQTNPFAGMADSFNSARKLDEVEKIQLDINRDQQQETAKLQRSQAAQAESNARTAGFQADLLKEQREKTEIEKTTASWEARNSMLQGDLIKAQVGKALSEAGFNSALAGKILSDKKLIDMEVEAEEHTRGIRRYTGPIKEVLGTIQEGAETVPTKKGMRGPLLNQYIYK